MRWLIPLLLSLLLLSACGERQPPTLKESKELIVLTREGPTTYTRDDAGNLSGFEYDLAQLFAEELGLPVRFVVVRHDKDIVKKLKAGKAHFGAAWLSPPTDPALIAGPSYFSSSNIIAQHEGTLPIDTPDDLDGKSVQVLAKSRQATALHELKKQFPNIQIEERKAASELELLERIAEQRGESALVDRAILDIASNFYPQLEYALTLGTETPIAWVFPAASEPELLSRAASFFERLRAEGTLAKLTDRYFGHVERLSQADALTFIERIRTTLPPYRPLFQAAQASTGIDWRLLAALAYQESQWNPLATSPTGVRGMMMLTEDTADHLRVSNRLDPKQSIRAGSQYFSDLRDSLPDSVPEPDRSWMAIAAYNLGMGHFNGARHIAQGLKKDTDSWYEMKAVLPLLARPQYYERLKSGKARGGEAVITAENVRMYYAILSRYEAPYSPGASSQSSAEIRR
ncbi:MAG: membrane-bound lytic murein transglycosylase MltF [Betaproteobacteria bacterium]|uniref:Membrane-bound lytic murein transglycosylase MltF n=1 Tax=Candidatus Proximibacter danicus TaxID=2954365 RepID=A0A9D7PS97_9PROT|nr:membrane-bound lytic murein transglycosylase MltF [Candidatus Proximibacter danicus]